MSSGMIQDSLSSSPAEPSSSGPRFRPFASPAHHVTKSRYITSNDPRGYIPVYEYPLNGQWIMMDVDDGYVLWTGIWKALGNSKADIVKMIESQPDLASQIRRVRGGYLKIQGTWMPYEVALRLSRRVAWPIRNELVPLFGPTFPSTCLSPDQPGYGQVVVSSSGRRRSRRATQAVASNAFPAEASEPQAGWTIISAGPVPPHDSDKPLPSISHPSASSYPPVSWSSGLQGQHQRLPPPQLPRLSMSAPDPTAIDGGADRLSTDRGRGPPGRYSPYPGASYASTKSSPAGNPPQSFPESFAMSHPHHFAGRHEQITLPPIQPPSKLRTSDQPSISLPPISSWAGSRSLDSVAILQRLQSSDAGVSSGAIDEDASRRRHSLSLPSRQQVDAGRLPWANAYDETSQRNTGSSAVRSSPRISITSYRYQADSSSNYPSPSASLSSSTNGGVSPSDPSPILPTTPRSILGPGSPSDAGVGLSALSVSSSRERLGSFSSQPHRSPDIQARAGQERAWSQETTHPDKYHSSHRVNDVKHWGDEPHSPTERRGSAGQPIGRPVRPW